MCRKNGPREQQSPQNNCHASIIETETFLRTKVRVQTLKIASASAIKRQHTFCKQITKISVNLCSMQGNHIACPRDNLHLKHKRAVPNRMFLLPDTLLLTEQAPQRHSLSRQHYFDKLFKTKHAHLLQVGEFFHWIWVQTDKMHILAVAAKLFDSFPP
jgi:hypothetical protein